MSRAFCNHWMKTIVPSTPYTCQIVIDEITDDFVVTACNGLWDFVDDTTVRSIVSTGIEQGLPPHRISETVVEHSLNAGSTDNISVCVLQLHVGDEE